MKQTKIESILEVSFSYLIGFAIAYATYKYLVPLLFNVQSTHAQTFGITVLFTLISVVRSYIVRRFFNWQSHRDCQNG